ncbi:hypothetical protein BDM02DRAFT_3182051 [Thelephora ganbajun]|uniref:Uncharacterized protein n=1 Tax=Thelephora ganbajun TaxID=370292 RepID=A0ACB6ZXE5_THEGA|nr:hypothetical protein BDM02DRAFT_3182051 [Thelephora ganbajun]
MPQTPQTLYRSMDFIRQRFLQAEQDFLLAARSDTRALAEFADRWETLRADWESCLREADACTQQLVNGVVTRIEELAVYFHDSESRNRSLEDDLIGSLEDVFASLALEDCTIAGEGLITDEPSEAAEPSSPDSSAASPAQWLLHNLHNPYPLPHVPFTIGRSASSKYTKDWFAKARQRIGWTRLLRDRFSGCRTLAIDAAFRAFVRDDPNNPLDADLKVAFLAIKSHAEFVYGDETVVPQSSSKRLRSVSPTPSLTFSSSSEDTDDELYPISPLDRSFKRPSKRTSSDLFKPFSPKRRRTESPPPLLQPSDVVSPYTKTPPLRSRKRRLSESDSDYSQPKRPRGMGGGRPYAVSDPLSVSPVPVRLDFDQTFQIPNPASISPPDPTSFDLDFFNLPPCIGLSNVVSSTDTAVSADAFTTLFEIPQIGLLQPALPSFDSDWTEFLNFEPYLSHSRSSPLLTPSSASTPLLVYDPIISPSSPPDSGFSSPNSFLDILPHLSEKSLQFPIAVDPTTQGQDFLLPPGDDAGIPFPSASLSIH